MKIKDKVWIVEDEQSISSFISMILTANGYDTIIVNTGEEALTMISSHCPDLIVLDLGLPDMDGLEVLRSVRKWSSLPIVVVSARNHERDKVEALDYGADDYLVKPFSFQELEARIKALLRRTGAEPAVPLLGCGDLTLDPSSHRAIRGKVVIDLTVKEYRLLEYLIQNQGTAQSRLTLLKNVWDKNFDTNTNVVDVYVNYLRSKIDKDFDHKLIRTVVGVGYMMEA